MAMNSTKTNIFKEIILALSSMFFSGLVLGFFIILGLFYAYSRDLPDPAKLAKYEPAITTRLYANDGKLMAEYATEKRMYLPLESIPKRVIGAFLSAEDQNFYSHTGLDFYSIMRAALTNLSNMTGGRSMVGGSTITQQVVKNFLLTNERTLERKIKEAILAFRIDRIYSKDRILELYLNQIYLGGGSYGVAAAALNYFNKALDELTIAEAAYLAALPKAPANYDPVRNYDRAKTRRDWVIGRMLEDTRITPEEAQLAEASPLTVRKRDATEVVDAPFFAEEVRRRLAKMYGSDVLYKGGLYVKTTIDATMQDYADKALRHALVEYDRRHGYRGPIANLPTLQDWQKKIVELSADVPLLDNQTLAVVDNISASSAGIITMEGKKGAIPIEEMRWARRFLSETSMGAAVSQPKDVLMVGDVVLTEPQMGKNNKPVQGKYRLLQIPKVNGGLMVMDPHTGRILAISGGYSAMGTQFNRATQARRQPGSAFKPFVYLAGLEAGYQPNSILWDSPISLPQGPGLPYWTPQNYSNDYLGPVPFRMGIEKSRNAMTVYLASRLGIKRIRELSNRMGIYPDLPAEYSAVLGSRETTLKALINAYGMLVNGGKRIKATAIERIDDRYGKTIYRRDQRECKNCQKNRVPPASEVKNNPPRIVDNREQVLDPAIAYQMVSMLQGVVERGTAIRAKQLGLPLGGKTGTTNDSRDTWFVGFSPDLVVGLYVGYDQPKSLGEKETGSSVALPGFIKFMEMAYKNKTSRAFTIPKGIQLVKVNRYSGRPAMGYVNEAVILEAIRMRNADGYTPEEGEVTEAGATEQPAPSGANPLTAQEPLNNRYPRDPNWPGYERPEQKQVPVEAPPPVITYGEDEEPQEQEEQPTYYGIPGRPPHLNRRFPMRDAPTQGTGGIY